MISAGVSYDMMYFNLDWLSHLARIDRKSWLQWLRRFAMAFTLQRASCAVRDSGRFHYIGTGMNWLNKQSGPIGLVSTMFGNQIVI